MDHKTLVSIAVRKFIKKYIRIIFAMNFINGVFSPNRYRTMVCVLSIPLIKRKKMPLFFSKQTI